jgi:hypothetical protein
MLNFKCRRIEEGSCLNVDLGGLGGIKRKQQSLLAIHLTFPNHGSDIFVQLSERGFGRIVKD